MVIGYINYIIFNLKLVREYDAGYMKKVAVSQNL